MKKNISFTDTQKEELIQKAYRLLSKHNNSIKLHGNRILNRRDEDYITGCKANLSRRTQNDLSDNQYHCLFKLLEYYKSKPKPVVKKISTQPKPVVKDKPKASVLSKQQKLKEIILKLK